MQRGLSIQTIVQRRLGVITSDVAEERSFIGRVSIPYLNANGDVSQIRYRAYGKSDRKYLGETGVKPAPYGVAALASPHPETGWQILHVCEGEFDAMILGQCGYSAIALPGVATWSEAVTMLVEPYEILVVWSDPDPAGDKMYSKVKQVCENALVLRPRLEQDVSDTYVADGEEAIHSAVAELLADS